MRYSENDLDRSICGVGPQDGVDTMGSHLTDREIGVRDAAKLQQEWAAKGFPQASDNFQRSYMSENEINPALRIDAVELEDMRATRESAGYTCGVALYDQSTIDRLTAERDDALAALDRIVSLKMSIFKDPCDMIGECVNIAADAIDAARAEG